MNSRTRQEILEFLEDNPRGSTVTEVGEEIDVSRVTASKYLEVLSATEEIDVRHVGQAKLHYRNQEKQVDSKGDSGDQ